MPKFGLTAVVLAGAVMLWISSASADTIPVNADPACPTTGTLQDLINFGAGGCTISVGGGASLTVSDFFYERCGNSLYSR
jgi:hypothetical protein